MICYDHDSVLAHIYFSFALEVPYNCFATSVPIINIIFATGTFER
jgi:hypothetical protein